MKSIHHLAAIFFLCSPVPLLAQSESLCFSAEEVFFSCNIENSAKLLSICGKIQGEKYIQYRYGRPENIELIFPKVGTDAFKKFSLGWGLSQDRRYRDNFRVNFSISSYEYSVFRSDFPEDFPINSKVNEPWVTKDRGVTISSKSGKETTLTCAHEPTPVDRLHELPDIFHMYWHPSNDAQPIIPRDAPR
jgi:hypothetical protein